MNGEQSLARQAQQERERELRSFHGYVCEQLDSPRRGEILRRASERIALWERDKLCSRVYISFWKSVVRSADSAAFKAKVLDAPGPRGNAMMQNTPFSFLMRERG